MRTNQRPRVLLMFPGPLFNIQEFLHERLKTLSSEFDGAVVTFGEKPARVTMGRFEVVALQFQHGQRLASIGKLVEAAESISTELERRSGDAPAFDLVVSYDALKTGIAAWRVARKVGAKLVVEVNGDCFAAANYADIRNPLRRKVERAAFIALTAFILGRAEGIKTLFREQIEPFRWLLGRPVVRRFPNFVDLSYFHDRGESPEILLAGFPFRVKGVDILIDAFKLVCDRHPDWRLSIIGWYPDPREVLRAIDGHPRITLLPPVHRHEVAELIGRCGIFALPSRTEGIARVLMEAAACGKIRIATTVGGLPDVVTHEEDGLLCAAEDVPALAGLLDRAMSDGALRARMGANAKARAEREFSGSAYLAKTLEFYRAVLAT